MSPDERLASHHRGHQAVTSGPRRPVHHQRGRRGRRDREGTIFRVFASKQDLMHAVVADILDTASQCRRIEALPTCPTSPRI